MKKNTAQWKDIAIKNNPSGIRKVTKMSEHDFYDCRMDRIREPFEHPLNHKNPINHGSDKMCEHDFYDFGMDKIRESLPASLETQKKPEHDFYDFGMDKIRESLPASLESKKSG